jgi:hypothetical protein
MTHEKNEVNAPSFEKKKINRALIEPFFFRKK